MNVCAQLYESSSFVGVFFHHSKSNVVNVVMQMNGDIFPAFCRVQTYVVHTHTGRK